MAGRIRFAFDPDRLDPGARRAPSKCARDSPDTHPKPFGSVQYGHRYRNPYLNTATRAQLMELPGVDGIRADLILAHRRAIGAFRTHTQLREVYGISDAIWEQVADRVTVQTGVAGGGVSAGTPAGAGNRVFRPALPQSPTRPHTPALPTPPAPPVVGR